MIRKKEEKIKRALRLVSRGGLSYREAAKRVGLHWNTVWRWAKKEGIESKYVKRKSLFEKIKSLFS